MGELLIGTDSCAWGVIEFIQNPCPGSAVLRVEFESSVPEQAHIYFNGVALVEGYLDSGEHVFDVTDLMDEDYNYIDAFIGDDFQAFFILGEVDICEGITNANYSDAHITFVMPACAGEMVQLIVNNEEADVDYLIDIYAFPPSQHVTGSAPFGETTVFELIAFDGASYIVHGTTGYSYLDDHEEIQYFAETGDCEEDEDETPKGEDETPEGPFFTGKKETLPTTGGKHQKMLILALAITATGMALVYSSRRSYK